MDYASFANYLPHKSFLVYGTEVSFDDLLGQALAQDPMVHALSVPRFTVDHARTLGKFLIEGDGGARVHLVYFDIFSPDAAQVLLKSLEEPDQSTTIILMTPHPYLVPMTIRSRVMLLGSDVGVISSENVPETARELLALIKEEFGTDSDDDAATKRARAVHILDTLESRFRTQHDKIAAIYTAKQMLYKANMPTKFVLEYAASML